MTRSAVAARAAFIMCSRRVNRPCDRCRDKGQRLADAGLLYDGGRARRAANAKGGAR